MPFYEKGDVRIRYEEAGSGFPLLVTPGGGLNSRVSNWPTAVFNAMEVFKNDFRCITMDQRNATGGESTGPVAVDDPWGAFADDQLGLMDHLGIKPVLLHGLLHRRLLCDEADAACAGSRGRGRAVPDGGALADEDPDVMYRSGRDVWAPEFSQAAARRDDGDDRDVSAQSVSHAAGLCLQRVAGVRAWRARRRCWCCRMILRRIRCRHRRMWRRWRLGRR